MDNRSILTLNCSDSQKALITSVSPENTVLYSDSQSDSLKNTNYDLTIIDITKGRFNPGFESGIFLCIIDNPEQINLIDDSIDADVISSPLCKAELKMRVNSLLRKSAARKKLTETEHILKRLEEAGQMGYFIADFKNPENNRLSDAGFRMIGNLPNDHIPTAESFKTYLHPDDVHKLEKCQEDMASKGRADKEFRIQRRDTGEWFWMLARTTFFEYDSEGVPIKSIGIHQDITRLKEQENLIDEERKQFLSILNTIPQPMYVADLDTHELLFINDAIRNAQLAGDNPLSKKCYELFYDSSEPCEFCSNHIIRNQKGPYTWDKKNPKNGRHYQVTDQVIKWSNGKDVRFGACIDITEQVQVNNILRDELALNKQKLGMASLHNMSKNDLIEDLRGRLETFKGMTIQSDDIGKLLNFIDKSIKIDEQWTTFKKHFEEVHSGFFTRLGNKYPRLTDKERKVCAYYRVNLSNKEIALLLGIAPDSVKKGRNRLRKKLELTPNQSIVPFLETI